MLERYEEEMKNSWTEQETFFKNMEVRLDQMLSTKDEVEEQEEEAPISRETSIENEVTEVCEPRIPYTQRLLEVTEEREDSLPKDLVEYHVEEWEEVNQGNPYSSEAESCIEEGLIEPPIQEAFDEEHTPIITQHPSLGIQE